MTKQETYKREKALAIERIKALGLKEPVSLDKVVSFLPVLPEWESGKAKERAK